MAERPGVPIPRSWSLRPKADRKSTRLNSSHSQISYAVFCLKKKIRDEDLITASPRRLREIRGNDIAMIFQDPMTSLNPVHTIGRQLNEAILLHQTVTKKQAS